MLHHGLHLVFLDDLHRVGRDVEGEGPVVPDVLPTLTQHERGIGEHHHLLLGEVALHDQDGVHVLVGVDVVLGGVDHGADVGVRHEVVEDPEAVHIDLHRLVVEAHLALPHHVQRVVTGRVLFAFDDDLHGGRVVDGLALVFDSQEVDDDAVDERDLAEHDADDGEEREEHHDEVLEVVAVADDALDELGFHGDFSYSLWDTGIGDGGFR